MNKTLTETIAGVSKEKWSEFEFIQPDGFKEMTLAASKRLRKSIIRNGFAEAFKAWRDPDSGKIYCLDGFHRIAILRDLKAEGWVVPERFTTVFVECESMAEAARRVLIYSSIYASVTEDGLYEYLNKTGIDLYDVEKEIDVPSLDLDDFKRNYLEDRTEQSPENKAPDAPDPGEPDYLIVQFKSKDEFNSVCEALGASPISNIVEFSDIADAVRKGEI